MILIADCHASARHDNEDEFFACLEHLARTRHDVVFLGDILDFWIALPGYEHELHRRFLSWCQAESRRRVVGFVEGNHEFFLAHSHSAAFSFCSPDEHVDAAGRLFVHGDTVNSADRAYRRFRRVVKCPLIRWLEEHTPGATAIARMIKRRFEVRGRQWPRYFPEAQLDAYAQGWFDRGVQALYLGHFHQGRVIERPDGRVVQIIPAWQHDGLVGVLDGPGRVAEIRPWRDVPVA